MSKNLKKKLDVFLGGLNDVFSEMGLTGKVVMTWGDDEPEDKVRDISEGKKKRKKESDDIPDFEDMSPSELKEFAKEHGVSTVGTIQGLVTKLQKKFGDGKPSKNSKVEAEEVNEELLAELEEMETEDIAELLRDNGIKIKGGKREVLIDAVVKAVAEGKIEFEDSDEAEEKEKPKKEKSSAGGGRGPKKMKAEDIIHEPFDVWGFADQKAKGITPERKKALKVMMEQMEADLESDTVPVKDMIDYIEEWYDDQPSGFADSAPTAEVFKAYYALNALAVNDEGEYVDYEEPYTVNAVPFCCHRPLEKGKNNTLKCPFCNNKYEAEEDDSQGDDDEE